MAGAVEIANFPEASAPSIKGPYDLSLVEGSITTPHDAERIHEVRRQSKFLVTIGACATAGGIQALRNFADVNDFVAVVYAIAAIHRHAGDIDADLGPRAGGFRAAAAVRSTRRSCIEVISAFLAGRKPAIAAHSVCIECKLRGTVCVMVPGHPLPRAGDACRLRRALSRPTTAAATAASARRRRRTRRRWRAQWQALGATRARPAAASSAPSMPTPSHSGRRATPMTTKTIQRRLSRARRRRGRARSADRGRQGAWRRSSRFSSRRGFFEAFLRGRGFTRGARHHRAHLRHLSGRLPDERRPRDGGCLRRRRSTASCARCAACSTAANGSKATRCIS